MKKVFVTWIGDHALLLHPLHALTDDLRWRPKFNLGPHSVKTEVNNLADSTARMAIFDEGKPCEKKEHATHDKEREWRTLLSTTDN